MLTKDLIKQIAIDAFVEWYGCKPDDFDAFEEMVEERILSAQREKEKCTGGVAPVFHAHWELDPNGMDFGLPAWKCSLCGRKNTMIPSFIPTEHGGYVPKNPNAFAGSDYCPNCGARMDEVDE